MTKSILLLIALWIILAPSFNSQQQTGKPVPQHFDKAGLTFDFPSDWLLTEKSADEVQSFSVNAPGNSTQITVIDQSALVSTCTFQGDSKIVTDGLLSRLATQIHAPFPLQTSDVGLQIGSERFEGLQIHGRLNNQPITGEIYSLKMETRFVNLVYLRLDSDQRGRVVWEAIRGTLTIPKKQTVVTAMRAPIRGGVMNGRAIHLAQPPYPMAARQGRISGMVTVQVIIDEAGKIVFADATDGPFELRKASVEAAKGSTFSPTKLCGEPVKVSGIIQYNFIAQ